MKKIISLVFAMLLLFCNTAFAAEEEPLLYAEAAIGLPKTYNPDEISLFSTAEAELERRILEGWKNLEASIIVYDLQIPLDTALNLYEKILHQNPLCYYVNTTKINYSSYSSNGIKYIYRFKPLYTETDLAKIKNTLQAIQLETDKILMTIDNDMSDFEKVIAVHDYMVLNYHYDNTLINHAITIMITKYGVCESYAYAFMHVMNELNIDCTFVSSKTMQHAWNLVKIDGEWYHIDLTRDDPQNPNHNEDNCAVVEHTYALLSTSKVQSLPKPYYGFDLDGLEANSTRFEDATWHTDSGAIAHVDGMEYWVDGNNLVREDGKIIFENLDGDDGHWNISVNSGFEGMINTGLIAYNELLYFNNETTVYTYNPKTDECKKFHVFTDENNQTIYLDGLYLDGNHLHYSKHCPNCNCNHFIEGGSIKLSDFTAKAIINKSGKLVVRMIKENDKPVTVFSFNGSQYGLNTLEGSGYQSFALDAADEQTLFFWDENLKPLKPKEVIKR